MARWPWFERPFRFDYPASKFPELLERWRGTPARLEERLAGVGDEAAARSDGRGWSIKQNVGHLIDLDYLPVRRLGEILAGEATLVAADLTNRRTNEGDHNARPLADLLADFRRGRMAGAAKFEAVPESDWGRAALHPRLKQPMRIVDILHFDSEHDDYHLGRIAELLRTL
ncbi:DinB superfamily protein [Phycisphaerae bacterium RAS1]|nr:DinB superfamily protein [Phycisphaerae bacterium RAS1]